MLIYLLFLCRGLRYYSTHRGHQFCSSIYLPTASMRNRILKTNNFNRMIIVSRIIKFHLQYYECSIDLKKVPVYPFSGLFARLLISCLAFENPTTKINASCKGRNFKFFILYPRNCWMNTISSY